MNELDRLKHQLAKGEISRRDFLRTAAALGAGTAALSSGLGFMWPREAAAAPKRGGHFRIGIAGGSTTDSLDPGTYSDNFMQCVGHALHNCLTEVTHTGELIGELATDWEASPDAREWTFRLRRGVTFHNGKNVEATDVIASLNHHRGEDSKSGAKSIVEPIESLSAPDAHTVVIRLSGGNADFPFLMSDYHLPVMPSEDGQVNPGNGIGCGAFMLENFEPGVKTVVKRNPDYWKSDRGWFDAVTFMVMKDVVARQNALTTGEIDAINRVDLKTIHLLQKHPQVNVEPIDGGQHYTAPMITEADPYTDNNIRMAIKHSIDRQEILDKVLKGYGSIGNDQPISSSYRYFADLPQREYDPDRARHFLKKAGRDRLSVKLSTSEAAFSGATDTALLIQESAKKAGIDIDVVREPDDGYWSNVWMKKSWCMSYWGGKPTEDWMFSLGYASGASWNSTFWGHERFDKLLVEARAELDTEKRADMYGEMQRLVRDRGGMVLPVFANYIDAARTNVGYDRIASNWDLDGLRVAERWWFKDA